jgi:serine/threonine protein kinase
MGTRIPLSTASRASPSRSLFVPPEILDGESSQVDPQTDVYSVGVMLYGLLAGRFPYSQSDGVLPEPRQLGELVLNGPPAPLRSLKPGISRDLEAICATAMSRFKISRYATMLELADDIRAALELRPVKARRPGPVLKVKRFAQRHAGYVSLACLIAVIIAVGFAVAGRLQRERDVARQVQAVHDGELAGRSGHWREALSDWDLAQSAGYKDTVYLDLQRAEAWTILSEPDRSGALLKSLSQRSNLGAHKGAVLLRLGEHELFDEATARQGAQHVREALDAGLDPSDELVARGLLADSTPEALDFFHRAIKMNSFNHSAHRHSLGLEFLLGRHADLQDSIRFFSAIYPDDPSPGFLEAAEFAMQGRLKEAQARMMELRDSVGTAEWEQANDGLPAIVAAVKHFDPDAVLTNSHSAINAMDFFKAAQGVARLGASASGSHSARHTPYLPSVEKGLLEGREALGAMMLPSVGNVGLSVKRIKASWKHHPEALVPAFAAIYLESRQPTNGTRLTNLLTFQADLFQLAADSPSLLAGLDRTSRYLAAKTELELLQLNPTNAPALRLSCVGNIQQALSSPETSTAEFKAYFGIAMQLGEYDTARELLVKWEHGQPQDSDATHSRIDLEIVTGNLESAWKLVNSFLAASSNDTKALIQRQAVQRRLGELNQLIQPSADSGPLSKKP